MKSNYGYIMNLKKPTRDGYVACLVITPKDKDGVADTACKLERNISRTQAISLSIELLKAAGCPDSVLGEIGNLDVER